MTRAGYSGTPLAKKLGIRDGFIIRLINRPEHYFDLFTDLPGDLILTDDAKKKKNFIHFFTKDAKELLKVLPCLRQEILPDGMIWVSWPKKSSKVLTDVSENLVRNTALANGLVDIKVCAVDETWSGLKMVIPVKDR
jgi:hypothetical protein